jgi:CMP-N-acetylneuraminic acid synthetase
MKILITICGRGGSKGIPGKNIKLLNNIPLIAYTIKHAFQFCNLFDAEIALSTDSDSIKKIASDYKLNTLCLIYNKEMPSFKPKSNKKIKFNKKSAVTLDIKHKEFINEFVKYGEKTIFT